MKHFVAFSDLHLHAWNYGATIVNGKNSRLEQQVKVVKSIVSYCKEREIQEVVFCGDLFHTSTITAEVSQAAYQAFKGFKENGIQLTVLVGNHDQSSRTGGIHALSWLGDHGKLIERCLGEVDSPRIAGLPAYFFPYTADEDTLKGWLREVNQVRCFMFFHQGVGGVEINSKGFTLNEILTPAMVPGNCALALTGHYHSFKPVSGNLVIPGSTTQLNWGDEGEPRGWLDVTVDGEQVTEINMIESKAPKFITISEDNLETYNRDNPNAPLAENFVRVLSEAAHSPEEITTAVLRAGAASCEVKTIFKENPVFKTTATVTSLNEVIYSFAKAKEKAGIISEYDKAIGEQLLKRTYCVPQV